MDLNNKIDIVRFLNISPHGETSKFLGGKEKNQNQILRKKKRVQMRLLLQISNISKHFINRKKKRSKCFTYQWKCLPCLSFFYFPHQDRSVLIASLLWESQSMHPTLASIMAPVCLSHKNWMRTLPMVSNLTIP